MPTPARFGPVAWAGATNAGHLLVVALSLNGTSPQMVWISALDNNAGSTKWSTGLPGTWPSGHPAFVSVRASATDHQCLTTPRRLEM